MGYKKVDGFDRNLLISEDETNHQGGQRFLLEGKLAITPHELEILKLSSEGNSANEVADELGISLGGVKRVIDSMISANDTGNGKERPSLTEIASQAESMGVLNNLFIDVLKRKAE